MARFVRRILAFLALQGLIFAVLLTIARIDPTHFEASAIDKHHRLEQLKSPRLIIVGGSSTCFGFNSPVLEQGLHRPTVNMGIHQCFGLDYMLAEVSADIRSGDLVVIAPEYEHFERPRRLYEQFWHAPLFRREAFRYWLSTDMPLLLDEGLGFVGIVTQAAWNGHDPNRHASKPYSRDSFNEYGDIVAHGDMPRLPIKRVIPGAARADEIHDRVARFAKVIHGWERRGARVVISFPPVTPRYERGRSESIKAVIRETKAALGDRVLERRPVSWPIESFFDTDYHLVVDAMRERSEELIRSLSGQPTGDDVTMGK
jgi:hypothetical protein